MRAIRWGLIFGAGIAAANLLLQFVVTPFVPWQLIGLLSVSAWLAGIVAAGVVAGRASLRVGASAAAIATVVDLLRNAAVAIAVGVPPIPSSTGQGSPTPGLIIAATIVEFMLIGPLAAGIGMAAARLTRRSPVPQTFTGD